LNCFRFIGLLRGRNIGRCMGEEIELHLKLMEEELEQRKFL